MDNSSTWIDAIIPKLFAAEDRYQDKLVNDLNKANCEHKKAVLYGFNYMGMIFVPQQFKQLRYNPRLHITSLDFELLDKSAELYNLHSRIELDKSQIRQVLYKLLRPCTTLQEIRDVLPECLIPLVPELAGLQRTVEDPLYMLQDDRGFIEQFKKILLKIEFYAMSRLIY